METEALDAIDRRILSDLVADGRATFAQLAEAVGLSPHAVADRVRRLVQRGVIRHFTATIDFGAIGRGLDAFVDVRLLPSTDPDRFEAAVEGMPQVREILFVTGRFDYQLRLACADADDLDAALRSLRTKAGAAVTETRIVLRARAASAPPGGA